MNTVKSREKSDSIFANKLPIIAKETVRMKTISQKKKGIAGLFGKKEIVQIPYYTNELRTFNDKLIFEIDKQNAQVETYTDSLRLQNKLLNNKLYDFVSFGIVKFKNPLPNVTLDFLKLGKVLFISLLL